METAIVLGILKAFTIACFGIAAVCGLLLLAGKAIARLAGRSETSDAKMARIYRRRDYQRAHPFSLIRFMGMKR